MKIIGCIAKIWRVGYAVNGNVDPVSEIVQEMIPKIECMAEEKTTEIERMKSRTEKFLYAV